MNVYSQRAWNWSNMGDKAKARKLEKRRRKTAKRLQERVAKRQTTPATDKFFTSREWVTLRYKALIHYGRQCKCCGARPPTQLHVDHIKPRSKYPHLALEMENLQILCRDCNMGKSNIYEHDFRVIRRPAPVV